MPIIDEIEKEEETQTEGTNDGSIPELTTAKSAPVATPAANVGGAGNATAPKAKGSNSGSFQDFSKFQDANKGKIQALGNLTTGGAQQSAQEGGANRQKALDSSSSKIQESYGDPSQYGGYNAGNIVNKQSEVADTLSNLSGTIDYGKDNQYGASDAVKAEQDYGSTVQGIAGATDRAGVGQLLGQQRDDGQASARAGDSLLLRGNQGFRQNMADTITQTGDAFNAATADGKSALDQIAGMSETANTQRADSRGQLIDRLGNIQTGVNKSVADQVAADQAAARAGANSQDVRNRQIADWQQSLIGQMSDPKITSNAGSYNTAPGSLNLPGDLGSYTDQNAINSAINDPAKFKEITGLDLNQMFSQQNKAYGDTLAGNINTRNTMSGDQAAQLNALGSLMGGGGVIASPTQRGAVSAQELSGFTPEQRSAAINALRSYGSGSQFQPTVESAGITSNAGQPVPQAGGFSI